MTPPPILTVALLERFEALVRDQRAPLGNLFQPGLSDEEIDSVTASIGVSVPAEARTWWRWHNGARADPDQNAREFGPGAILPLEEAVKEWRVMREIAEDLAAVDGFDADLQWRQTWLPVTTNVFVVVCDCSVPPGAPTTMHVVYSQSDPDTFGVVRARSFAEMVSWWVDALEVGAYRYDDQTSRWHRDESLIGDKRIKTWLV